MPLSDTVIVSGRPSSGGRPFVCCAADRPACGRRQRRADEYGWKNEMLSTDTADTVARQVRKKMPSRTPDRAPSNPCGPPANESKTLLRADSKGLVLNEGPPTLRGRMAPPRHVAGHRSLRNLEPEFEQLAMNSRRSPQEVLLTHPRVRISLSIRGRGPGHRRLELEARWSLALDAPAQDRRGLDDHQATLPIRPPARQQNPKQLVTAAETGTTRVGSNTSPFSPVTVPPASSTRARFCSNVWQKKKIARADLEKTIAEALDGDLCRCTGYVKYHEAVRAVVLADPSRYLS